DPLHDLFVLVDLHFDRLLHRLVLLSGVASPGGAARGDRWDSQNLTGVLVATVRNPSRGPGARLTNGLQCQRNDGVGRAAPHQGFHARAAPHRDMRTDPVLATVMGPPDLPVMGPPSARLPRWSRPAVCVHSRSFDLEVAGGVPGGSCARGARGSAALVGDR